MIDRVAAILAQHPDIAQTLLDRLNDCREPSTPPYESLNEVSDKRLCYWVLDGIRESDRCADRNGMYASRCREVFHILADIHDILFDEGILSDPEGWGVIRFGVVDGNKKNIYNMRHVGGKKWVRL